MLPFKTKNTLKRDQVYEVNRNPAICAASGASGGFVVGVPEVRMDFRSRAGTLRKLNLSVNQFRPKQTRQLPQTAATRAHTLQKAERESNEMEKAVEEQLPRLAMGF